MSDQTTPVIELQGLAVQFGGRPILKGLNASLTGRCIGLLGPNGAGKTTLLHTLLGFHAPTTGTARIFGHDIQTEARLIRGLMGYMPESDSFIAGMTAVRFVRLMGELSGLPSERALERAHETLFYVGLGEARYRNVDTYSLGMKQLAKLAQALVHGPRLHLSGRADQRPRPVGPGAHAPADPGHPRHGRGQHHSLFPSAARRRGVLRRGARPQGRRDRHLLQPRRGAAGQPQVPGDRGAWGRRGLVRLRRRGPGLRDGRYGAKQKIKVVLPEGIEVRDLYRLAAERQVQIRRLDYKKDSLQDIFLKAMETEANANGRI